MRNQDRDREIPHPVLLIYGGHVNLFKDFLKQWMNENILLDFWEKISSPKSVILSLPIVARAPLFSFEMSEIGLANLVQFLGSFPL